MEKKAALEIQRRSLVAIRELMAILPNAQKFCSNEECQELQRGVGLAVGRIQTDILELLNAQYPEIDDLT